MRTRPQNPNRRAQKGQTLVESALVLVSLLAMLLFLLDTSRYLFLSQYLDERASATARLAAMRGWTQSDVQNYFCYNRIDEPAGARRRGWMGIEPRQVSLAAIGDPASPEYRIKVTVSKVPAVLFTPFLAGAHTLPEVSVETPAQSMGSRN